MIVFYHERNRPVPGYPAGRVVLEIPSDDCSIHELVQAFRQFLAALTFPEGLINDTLGEAS